MPYSRHVGYLCPGITLSRRVITGRHAAPAFYSAPIHALGTHVHTHTYGATAGARTQLARALESCLIANYLLGLAECR